MGGQEVRQQDSIPGPLDSSSLRSDDTSYLPPLSRPKGGNCFPIAGQLLYFYLIFLPLCCCCLVAKSCLTLCNPQTVAHQAPLSMGFPRQEYWSGWPLPSQGVLPTQGSSPCLLLGRQILYHWATWEASPSWHHLFLSSYDAFLINRGKPKQKAKSQKEEVFCFYCVLSNSSCFLVPIFLFLTFFFIMGRKERGVTVRKDRGSRKHKSKIRIYFMLL